MTSCERTGIKQDGQKTNRLLDSLGYSRRVGLCAGCNSSGCAGLNDVRRGHHHIELTCEQRGREKNGSESENGENSSKRGEKKHTRVMKASRQSPLSSLFHTFEVINTDKLGSSGPQLLHLTV